MINNIKIFNNKQLGHVRTININNNIYFIGKDVAKALGYTNTSDALNKHVDDEDKVKIAKHEFNNIDFNNIDLSDIGTKGTILINESGMYNLIFGSKKHEAKVFKKWVTQEVLPTIRQAGCYISESATQESIDYQSKYGLRRIRKTINNNQDNIEDMWDEFKRLSKIERDAKRIDNKERVKACNIIIDELELHIAHNISTMKPSKVMLYKELITDVLNERQRLSNKMYGGKISNMNKKLKVLEANKPINKTFTTLHVHGFSENYMYNYNSNNSKVYKTKSYNAWINNFPMNEVPAKYEYESFGIDFTKPMGIELHFICRDDIDVQNLNKSAIDMIFNRILGVDDSIVEEIISIKTGSCNTYREGQISFAIYNL